MKDGDRIFPPHPGPPCRRGGRGLAALAAVVVLGAAVWLVWRALRPPSEAAVVPEPVAPAEYVPAVETLRADVRFADITDEAGVSFRHTNGARGRKLLPETMGGGCAFLDFDRDGDQDLLFVNSAPWPDDPVYGGEGPADESSGETAGSEAEAGKGATSSATSRPTQALYANDGSGHFRDVTEEVGLDVTFYGMGVAVGDVDRDGWDDIFFTAVGRDRFFRNAGGKRFVEATREVGLPDLGPHHWSTSAAFLDHDLDGWLDLFVCTYIQWSPELDLEQGFQITGIGRAYGPPQNFAGAFCKLYRNVEGRLVDVSSEAGVEVRNPHTGLPLGKALGVAVHDLDRDGYPDIAVANDTVQNFLFHNRKDGTFREVGFDTGIAFDALGNTRGAMGIDWESVAADGTQAIVVGNFSGEITALYKSTFPGDLPFTDDAVAEGIGNPSRKYMKFGVFFFDFDLDGRLDIFEANGHLEDEISKVQAEQTYAQPAQLFWNAGPGASRGYEVMGPDQVGADLFRPAVGRGAAYADIDGDGDLDVVLVANNGRARLFRNDGGNANGWIRLALRGTRANTNGFGARVEVEIDGKTRSATLASGRSYLSQCEQVVTFGLGESPHADAARVYWPGSEAPQELGKVEARSFLEVKER